MNVSDKDAQQSLAMIEDTAVRTRKAITSSYASGLLILWGLIWILSFASVHFWRQWMAYIFNTLNAIGVIATIVICRRWRTAAAVKSPDSQKIGWRIFALWALLFVYAFVWVLLLAPTRGIQVCAFLCTIPMFAYVVMGLWFGNYFMLWLGLAVTGLTLLGFYLFPHYFYLWMSPMGGGALLGTGLYIRLRWG
jgi:hypothetical protein